MKRLIFSCLLFVLGCQSAPPVPIPEPVAPRYATYGAELVEGLAACGFCHGMEAQPGSPLAGGREFQDKYGGVLAANITPSASGIGEWKAKDIVTALRRASGLDEELVSFEMHRGIEWMADEDIYAIVAYLRTVPPVKSDIERRSVSTLDQYTTGILEKIREVEGYVPSLSRNETRAYGKYLVDHVARCVSCHNKPASFFDEEVYLGGGREMIVDGERRLAPNITGSETFGLGSWKEEEIVSFLRTGRAPGNRVVDPEFCPVGFYKNARESDLLAIATYLRTVDFNER